MHTKFLATRGKIFGLNNSKSYLSVRLQRCVRWYADCRCPVNVITLAFVCCTRWYWPCAHSWAASCPAGRGGKGEASGRWTSYRAGRTGGRWAEKLRVYKTCTFSSGPYLGYFGATIASCPAQTDPLYHWAVLSGCYSELYSVLSVTQYSN